MAETSTGDDGAEQEISTAPMEPAADDAAKAAVVESPAKSTDSAAVVTPEPSRVVEDTVNDENTRGKTKRWTQPPLVVRFLL